MKCPDTGALQAYIDGELEIDSKKTIENHLGNREKCMEVLNKLKECDDFFRSS